MACFTGLTNMFRSSNKQTKTVRKAEKQRQLDFQRQKSPLGLLEIALKHGFKRDSFTATDPGVFYQKHDHGSVDPWKETIGSDVKKQA